jgi:hypothetical protein
MNTHILLDFQRDLLEGPTTLATPFTVALKPHDPDPFPAPSTFSWPLPTLGFPAILAGKGS